METGFFCLFAHHKGFFLRHHVAGKTRWCVAMHSSPMPLIYLGLHLDGCSLPILGIRRES